MWKNLKHLNADQTVKLVFTPGHFVSFRKARRLGPANIMLLSAKLECYEFSSHLTKETFKINLYFDCKSKSLIYLISFKVSRK